MVGFDERQETQADALQSSARLLEDVELWQLGLQQTSRANGAYLTYLVGTNGDSGTHDWINLVVPTNWLRTQLQYSLLLSYSIPLVRQVCHVWSLVLVLSHESKHSYHHYRYCRYCYYHNYYQSIIRIIHVSTVEALSVHGA